MLLENYYHKRIHAFLINDIQYIGKVVDYTDAEDNEADEEGNYSGEYITIVPESCSLQGKFVAIFSQDIIEIKVI